MAQGKQRPVAERLEWLTRPLLGARYALSPLGEARPPDADARLRFDAFDCTTFVETSLALVLAESEQDLLATLDGLRYKAGEAVFQARRHLMTAQWLPGLQELGVLKDITRSVDPKVVKTAHLELNVRRWRNRRVARKLELEEASIPFGAYALDYLPTAELERLWEDLPAGVILNVVREPRDGSPILVTHQVLVLDKPGVGKVARHATTSLGRVADQTGAQFRWLLSRWERWPVLGVNVQRVLVPR